MRTSGILAALSAAATVVYAKPVAQNGRWTPEWVNRGYQPSSSSMMVSAPAATGSTPATVVLGVPTATPNPPPLNADQNIQLQTAPLESDKITLLKQFADAGAADFKFDLNPAANEIAAGEGGLVVLANKKNFPVLTNLGTAFAGLFFQPCGLNTPHIHPRATEVFTLVTEGEMLAGFILDNTFTMEINETLTQNQGMAFPQGSIHYQLNQECHPAVGIAGFSNEDPGASSIANRFFSFSPDIVLPTLGFPSQIDATNFAEFRANIPTPFASAMEQCYAKCGIKV